MRTHADALRDPRPGDVVRDGSEWHKSRFEVTEVDPDGHVYGMRDYYNLAGYSARQWQEWMANAEVVHVAQEGGEG